MIRSLYDNPLPANWNEKPLAQMVELRRGCTWGKDDEIDRPEDDSVPVIRIPNIKDRLDLSDMLYLRNVSAGAIEKAAVSKGWILFVGSNGSQDRIGDSVLLEENQEMIFASFLMGITPKDHSVLLPDFFASWMRLHFVHEWFSKTSQQTTGLANYSWGAVKKLPVRFPSGQNEQRRIAAVLKLADDAVSKADDEIQAVRELKLSLTERLLTAGKNNSVTQTKFGPVPPHWEIKSLVEHACTPECVKTGPFGAQLMPEVFDKTAQLSR